jgi:hypothetical protein
MAEHLQFTVDSGVRVYFCDPRSRWQRGTNENTNGLLRQYLPKSAELGQLDQTALDAIAAELNGRPRQTLGFKTPSQALAEALRDPLRPPSFSDSWPMIRRISCCASVGRSISTGSRAFPAVASGLAPERRAQPEVGW